MHAQIECRRPLHLRPVARSARRARRFAPTDLLTTLFDWVDSEGAGGLDPGTQYALVTQYPRRVFRRAMVTDLAGAGLASREVLFVEPELEVVVAGDGSAPLMRD